MPILCNVCKFVSSKKLWPIKYQAQWWCGQRWRELSPSTKFCLPVAAPLFRVSCNWVEFARAQKPCIEFQNFLSHPLTSSTSISFTANDEGFFYRFFFIYYVHCCVLLYYAYINKVLAMCMFSELNVRNAQQYTVFFITWVFMDPNMRFLKHEGFYLIYSLIF